MSDMVLELRINADGKIAVRELTGVAAAEKAVENQTKAGTGTTREAKNELERYMASLRKEVDTLGMSRSQLRLYEAARLGATQADLRAIAVTNQLIDAQKRVGSSVGTLTRQFAGVASVAGALTIAKHLADASDNAVLLAARIGQVTQGLSQQKKVQEEIFRLAQGLQLPYMEMASQFPRIARAVAGYGGSTRDAIDVTKAFAQTVRISGASTIEAAASAMQFAQAIQSGRLAGDELRSILENNGVLADYLAKGLGVSVGELRKLGEEGKLTSEKVVAALLSQTAAIEAQAKAIPKTIKGSFAALENEIDRTTSSSKSSSLSIALMTGGVDLLTAAVKRLREEGKFELPFISYLKNAAAIAEAIASANTRGKGGKGTGLDPGMRALRGMEIDYTNEVTGPQGAAAAAAQRVFQELIKDTATATAVNIKYDETLTRLSESFAKLGGYASASQQHVAQFNEAVASNERDRRSALDNLAKRGVASPESETELVRKRADLQAADAEAYHQRQAAIIQRGLEAEEFYHQAGLTSEREYIAERAKLQEAAGRNAIDNLEGDLERELEVLAAIRNQRVAGPTAVKKHESDMAEQEKKILGVRTQLERATERLADVETNRGRAVTLLDQKILEGSIAIEREREDYARMLAQELADMQAEVELIGLSEIAQAKKNAQRRIENRYLEDRLKLERELRDLERKKADPQAVRDKQGQIDDLDEKTRRALERVPVIIEEQFRKELFKRVGDAVADAIVDGGPDAAKRLRTAIEDEFKKPIKLAISKGVQGAMEAAYQQFPALNPANWDSSYGAAGAVFGGVAANAAGAGPRGQAMAPGYAGAGAMIGGYMATGTSVGGYWGAIIGAIVGVIAAIATDPSGNAPRTARVGSNPEGRYTYAGRSPFGALGIFDDKWFSDEDMGDDIQRFLAAQGQLETSLAGRMTPEERARATASLAGSREYGFGEEQGRTLGLGDILKDRLEAIVEAALPGLGKLVQAFQGTGEELVRFVESLFGMRESLGELDKMIATMSSDSITAFKEQLKELDLSVTKAKTKLSEALDSGDATQIYAAEQELAAAVMNRYQTEIAMVEQLRDAIAELKEEAYQFQISIAQKINSVGGSRDIGAIALGRAGSLRAGIGGDYNIGGQARDLNRYVGSIDTWYQARRTAIDRQMAAEQESLRAIAQAQQAAAQARVAQLQGELQLAKQYQAIVDRTKAMIDDMRLSSANPLAIAGRTQMAGEDMRALLEQYRSATGAGRIDLAAQVLQAIQTYRSLGEEGYQRPSSEWQAIYNEIMASLTEVQEDAKPFAERSVELERQILEVQRQSAAYQASIASTSAAASAALYALDQEALGYYEWAEAEGARIFALQEQQHQEQLNAITGGMEVELFIAARQREAVDELREIRRLIAHFLDTAGDNVVIPGDGGGDGGGNGFRGTGVTPAPGYGTPVVLAIDGKVLAQWMVPAIDKRMDQRAPGYKRLLATS